MRDVIMPILKRSAPKKAKRERMKEEMHKFKEGTLKSSSGQMVTNPKQAIAISLSEAGMSRNKSKRSKRGKRIKISLRKRK